MGICKLGGKIRPARSDQVAEAAMEAAKILPEGQGKGPYPGLPAISLQAKAQP